jgi:hypothetical protein
MKRSVWWHSSHRSLWHSAFNYNRNGVLTCSELNSGLWWLGLQLEVAQIHSIVRSIDRDQVRRNSL